MYIYTNIHAGDANCCDPPTLAARLRSQGSRCSGRAGSSVPKPGERADQRFKNTGILQSFSRYE